MTKVFVAPKIRVGFQKRTDTFTGQLAYIIYYDEKGKIRKEKSWDGWRDHKIAPQEFDNKPMEGFTLNKDVKRYSGEWFSSHRTMIRVHDPRGFEFEVTTENLIGILMHTDCLRRGLIGKFVYAWVGPELVLLPTNSEEYQAATKYTAGLSKKVAAKELVPGISYKTKRGGDVIYIGRFNWHEYPCKSYARLGHRKEEKAHVFINNDGEDFIRKSSVEFLSQPNTDVPISNLADLIDQFNKKSYANKIVKLDFRPTGFKSESVVDQWKQMKLCRPNYWMEADKFPGVYVPVTAHIQATYVRDPLDYNKGEHKFLGYNLGNEDGYYYNQQGVKAADGELVTVQTRQDRYSYRGYGYSNSHDRADYTAETIQAVKLFDLYVVWENGKEKRVDSLYEFTEEEY